MKRNTVILFIAQFISACGAGLNLAGFTLFFVVARGFSASQVGVGVGLAGLIGFFLVVPLSARADSKGIRNHYLLLSVVSGIVVIALSFTASWWIFVLLSGIQSALRQAMSAVLLAMIGQLSGSQHRTQVMAKMRVNRNIGFSVGAVVASQILVSDSLYIQQLLVATPGLFLLLSAPLLLLLPNDAPDNTAMGASQVQANGLTKFLDAYSAVQNKAYVWLAVLNVPLLLHVPVLFIGVPLLLEQHTSAPRWLAGVFLMVNTVMVVLFQVRLARGVDSPEPALRCLTHGSVFLTLTFALMGSVVWLDVRALDIGVLALVVVVMTFSEMLNSISSWELSYSLAPEKGRSGYLGVFAASMSVQEMIGAPLLGLLLEYPHPVFFLAVFLLIGLATVGSRKVVYVLKPEPTMPLTKF